LDASSVSATEGNLEKVVADSTALTYNIADVVDHTTATLTSDSSVQSGADITYTVTLDSEVRNGDSPVVVTLSNGEIITIASGTTGSATVAAPVDGTTSLSVTIDSITQDSSDALGDFESLLGSGTAVTTIMQPPIIYDGSDWQVNKGLIQPKGNGSITFIAGGEIHFDFYVADVDANLNFDANDYADLTDLGLSVSYQQFAATSGNQLFRVVISNSTTNNITIDNSSKLDLEWGNVTSNLSAIGFVNSDEYVLLNNDGSSAPFVTDSFTANGTDGVDDVVWSGTEVRGQEFVKFDPINYEDGVLLDGGSGDDLIYGRSNVDQFLAAGDTIYGGDGNDVIDARAGNDQILGESGDDVIFGGSGDDSITGGTGDDILAGGRGSDSFIWNIADADGGTDTITDFVSGSGGDVLDLSDILQSNDAATLDSMLTFALDGANTKITLNNGTVSQTIVLENVDLVTGAADNQAIIQSLLDDGNLDSV
ncbi:MAG: type I secretion C-terminal target domain-containing protein, partial [Oceanospirillaceae bacterium]|nr:type I secretion C-terminal target domain-containing protein [Oceanospirillaceae bacterium]